MFLFSKEIQRELIELFRTFKVRNMTCVVYDLQAGTSQNAVHLLPTPKGNCLVFPARDEKNRNFHLALPMYFIA